MRWVRLVGRSGADFGAGIAAGAGSTVYLGGTSQTGLGGTPFLDGGLDGYLMKWE